MQTIETNMLIDAPNHRGVGPAVGPTAHYQILRNGKFSTRGRPGEAAAGAPFGYHFGFAFLLLRCNGGQAFESAAVERHEDMGGGFGGSGAELCDGRRGTGPRERRRWDGVLERSAEATCERG